MDHKKVASKGGKARARNLTPIRRSEIARRASLTRWHPEKYRKSVRWEYQESRYSGNYCLAHDAPDGRRFEIFENEDHNGHYLSMLELQKNPDLAPCEWFGTMDALVRYAEGWNGAKLRLEKEEL